MSVTNAGNTIKPNIVCEMCRERIIRRFMERTCEVCFTQEESEALATINPYLPTDAPPGSMMKVLVMFARAEARLPIFHPHDSPNKMAG